MKARLLLFVMLMAAGLVTSCSDDDDEPKINPLVGEWELDEVTVSDAPPSFSLQIGERSTTVYGESRYVIAFEDDFTYVRKVDNIPGFGNADDNGTWELGENSLILTHDDGVTGLVTDFELVEEVTDKNLVLEGEFVDYLPAFPDDIINDPQALDTIETQAGLNYMIENYSQRITVSQTLKFLKR